MSIRTRNHDYCDFLNAAVDALNIATSDGDRNGKHYPGEWMTESIDEQIRHIEAHVIAYICGDSHEDHLSHILCRAAIAVALRRLQTAPAVQSMPPCALQKDGE